MAWYHGTFSCGHEGRVNVIGPHKLREWKIERAFEKMCPECYEKWLEAERKRKNQEAAENAKEMELPELQGTEKQISWANTIRQEIIEKFDKIDQESFERAQEKGYVFKNVTIEDLPIIEDYILNNKIKAHWWIENKGLVFSIIADNAKEALKTPEEKAEEKLLKNIKIESTVYPENKITDAVVEIIFDNKKVSAKFEKNETFRLLVKSLGYSWNGIWEKNIKETTGTAEERAAELGNKLLNEGFPVCIMDEDIRNNAINGTYEPECTRWIYFREKENSFALKWKERSDKLYNRARSLPGSKWDSGVVVKLAHYKEIEEFAELYGFKFTSDARKAMEEYKEKLKSIEIVNPAKVEKTEHKDGLKEILSSSSDILEDLKED